MIDKKKEKLEAYNSVPVFYCKRCLSLSILTDEGDIVTDYCNDCGSADIGITRITQWEKLYNNKYNN